MQEIPLRGHLYKTGKLNALQQFHVSRRLAPIFAVIGFKAVALSRAPAEEDEMKLMDRFLAVVPEIANVLSKMTEEDTNYVLHTCLGVCMRQVSEGRWQQLIATGGQFMFDDIDMDVMMRLVIAVLQDNLAGFLPGQGGSTPSPSS